MDGLRLAGWETDGLRRWGFGRSLCLQSYACASMFILIYACLARDYDSLVPVPGLCLCLRPKAPAIVEFSEFLHFSA